MTKKRRGRPGPKSSKSKIVTKRGTLGEESSGVDETDERNSQETNENIEPAVTSDLNISSEVEPESHGEFRSPDMEDVTDYGLEFATSQLRLLSPPRCSTMRNVLTSRENQQTSNQASASNKQPQLKKPPRNATIQQATKNSNPTPIETTTNTRSKPETVERRRKRRNPIQLHKRFMKEVEALQNRTDNLVPMLPFSRLVREIMMGCSTEVTKITATAMHALQHSAELFMTQRLQDAYMLTLFRNRVTLSVKDMQMIDYLRNANI